LAYTLSWARIASSPKADKAGCSMSVGRRTRGKAATDGGRWTRGLFTAGLLLACLAACSTAPPEQRLRERIASMQAAIEAGESGGFMDGVADDFVGEGGMDRR